MSDGDVLEDDEKFLKYDLSDEETYGKESEHYYQRWQEKMFNGAMPSAPSLEQSEAVEQKYYGEKYVGQY